MATVAHVKMTALAPHSETKSSLPPIKLIIGTTISPIRIAYAMQLMYIIMMSNTMDEYFPGLPNARVATSS